MQSKFHTSKNYCKTYKVSKDIKRARPIGLAQRLLNKCSSPQISLLKCGNIVQFIPNNNKPINNNKSLPSQSKFHSLKNHHKTYKVPKT